MAKAPAIGIDLGTSYLRVGIFQHGRFEIIANEDGERVTPSYVAFTETECLIGDVAKNQAYRNPTNTIYDLNRLIGRKFDDPAIQQDMKHWPFTVKNVDNKPKIEVQYMGITKEYFPEEILAMLLNKMRQMAETYLGIAVTDAVVAVPNSFNYHQRQTINVAANEAGLNLLRFLGSSIASFAYGVDKKLSGEHNILIFDLGKNFRFCYDQLIFDRIFS